jgi:hypothetical protein
MCIVSGALNGVLPMFYVFERTKCTAASLTMAVCAVCFAMQRHHVTYPATYT